MLITSKNGLSFKRITLLLTQQPRNIDIFIWFVILRQILIFLNVPRTPLRRQIGSMVGGVILVKLLLLVLHEWVLSLILKICFCFIVT